MDFSYYRGYHFAKEYYKDEMTLYLRLVNFNIVLFLPWKNKDNKWSNFIDQSVILGPLNTLLNLCSKENFWSGPFVSKELLLAVPNNRELASVSR